VTAPRRPASTSTRKAFTRELEPVAVDLDQRTPLLRREAFRVRELPWIAEEARSQVPIGIEASEQHLEAGGVHDAIPSRLPRANVARSSSSSSRSTLSGGTRASRSKITSTEWLVRRPNS
jgi:hypothetical protein